jgi:hypothetical protein
MIMTTCCIGELVVAAEVLIADASVAENISNNVTIPKNYDCFFVHFLSPVK